VIEWLRDHRVLLEWLGAASLVTFVASLVLIPWLITRIPADYFLERRAPVHPFAARHPVVRALYHGLKVLAGAVLVLAGLAMLVLPGQGLLTIAAGVVLLEFPGKRRLERWMVRRRPVRNAFDWIRRKAGKAPLRIDGSCASTATTRSRGTGPSPPPPGRG